MWFVFRCTAKQQANSAFKDFNPIWVVCSWGCHARRSIAQAPLVYRRCETRLKANRMDNPVVGEVPVTCWAELGEHLTQGAVEPISAYRHVSWHARRETNPPSGVWLRRIRVTSEKKIPNVFSGRYKNAKQNGFPRKGENQPHEKYNLVEVLDKLPRKAQRVSGTFVVCCENKKQDCQTVVVGPIISTVGFCIKVVPGLLKSMEVERYH